MVKENYRNWECSSYHYKTYTGKAIIAIIMICTLHMLLLLYSHVMSSCFVLYKSLKFPLEYTLYLDLTLTTNIT